MQGLSGRPGESFQPGSLPALTEQYLSKRDLVMCEIGNSGAQAQVLYATRRELERQLKAVGDKNNVEPLNQLDGAKPVDAVTYSENPLVKDTPLMS